MNIDCRGQEKKSFIYLLILIHLVLSRNWFIYVPVQGGCRREAHFTPLEWVWQARGDIRIQCHAPEKETQTAWQKTSQSFAIQPAHFCWPFHINVESLLRHPPLHLLCQLLLLSHMGCRSRNASGGEPLDNLTLRSCLSLCHSPSSKQLWNRVKLRRSIR